MDRDNFYVVLPSANSMYVFPNNKTTRFILQLPRHLNLSRDRSVPLAEIRYPQTILHIPDTPLERNILITKGN